MLSAVMSPTPKTAFLMMLNSQYSYLQTWPYFPHFPDNHKLVFKLPPLKFTAELSAIIFQNSVFQKFLLTLLVIRMLT